MFKKFADNETRIIGVLSKIYQEPIFETQCKYKTHTSYHISLDIIKKLTNPVDKLVDMLV